MKKYEFKISRTIITKIIVTASDVECAKDILKTFSIMDTQSDHYNMDEKVTIKVLLVKEIV